MALPPCPRGSANDICRYRGDVLLNLAVPSAFSFAPRLLGIPPGCRSRKASTWLVLNEGADFVDHEKVHYALVLLQPEARLFYATG